MRFMLTKIPLYGDLDFSLRLLCIVMTGTCLPTVGGITTDAGDDVGRIAGGVSGGVLGGVLLLNIIFVIVIVVKVKVWNLSL